MELLNRPHPFCLLLLWLQLLHYYSFHLRHQPCLAHYDTVSLLWPVSADCCKSPVYVLSDLVHSSKPGSKSICASFLNCLKCCGATISYTAESGLQQQRKCNNKNSREYLRPVRLVWEASFIRPSQRPTRTKDCFFYKDFFFLY